MVDVYFGTGIRIDSLFTAVYAVNRCTLQLDIGQ